MKSRYLCRLACGSSFLFLALLLGVSYLTSFKQVLHASVVQTNVGTNREVANFKTNIIAGTSRLTINGHIVFEQSGVHLSQPLLSPDKKSVAVTVVPIGTQTSHLAEIHLYDAMDGTLLNRFPGHSPAWTNDQSLRFKPAKQTPSLFRATNNKPAPSSQITITPTYPTTIRVRHHHSNGCRERPIGQVDEIPFEEYVARSVPAEVPPSWPSGALKAQAVAARTYAWNQILVGRTDFDVSDWVDFQVMCDQRFPSTDAAVAQTEGQYLSAADDPIHGPILAMYSANNGHPTLTNINVSYLQAVPDLFTLGDLRNGHGYGLSQWGAQRRAAAGHSHRQILGHYYTNIHLQNALMPTPTLKMPYAGLLDLLPNNLLQGSGLSWRTLTPHDSFTPTLRIARNSSSRSGSIHLDGFAGVWFPSEPLRNGERVTTELWIRDESQDQVVLTVDTEPPDAPIFLEPGTLAAPSEYVRVTAAEDARLGLNLNWQWEGEALFHDLGSGELITDVVASEGRAWRALAGVHSPGIWYGPYTRVLPPNQSYRALFWLMSSEPVSSLLDVALPHQPIARLDVSDQEGRVLLGLRKIWLSDFTRQNIDQPTYQPISVDFHIHDAPAGIEFRVTWMGEMDLTWDRVEVWTRPTDDWRSTNRLHWTPYTDTISTTLSLAAFDVAGNISPPTQKIVQHPLRMLVFLPIINRE